jgi:hypothetical protein
MLAAPLANAQCPAGNPLQVLVGTWSFKAQGAGTTNYSSAGQFTATIGLAGQPAATTGLLSIVATTNFNNVVTRQERDTGRYQVFPDCSGVTLSINLSTRPIVVECWFLEGFTELNCVSIDPNVPFVMDASRIGDGTRIIEGN